MAARELGKVTQPFDPSEGVGNVGLMQEQAALANAGQPPLMARPATADAALYLKILGASAAWLAVPVGLAAGTVGAGAGALAGAAKTVISLSAGGGNPTANPAATGGVVPSPAATPASSSPFARLFAFMFPR